MMHHVEIPGYSACYRKSPHILVVGMLLVGSSVAPAHASDFMNPPIRLPSIKVGESISYSYLDHIHNATGGSKFIDSTLAETFDIKVLSATPKGAVIFWTLRSQTTSGDFNRGERFYAAFRDIPIEVQIDPSGIPLDVLNFDNLKDRLFDSALSDQARIQMQAAGSDYQKAGISLLFSQILVTIAAMQPREPIAFGHTVLDTPIPSVPVGPKISATRSIDLLEIDSVHCSARIARNTTQTIQFEGEAQSPSVLRTIATVSLVDGWVVALHETLDNLPGFTETKDIRRTTSTSC